MNKKLIALIVLIIMLVAISAEGGQRNRRAQRAGASGGCSNVITSTEDFTTDWNIGSASLQMVVNGDIDGPIPGTRAQLWTATATTGSHSLNSSFVYAEDNLYSIYVKPYSTVNYIKLSMYDTVLRQGAWNWDGSAWNEYAADADLTSTGEEDVGNGWWRLWIYVDGVDKGVVDASGTLYIYAALGGANEGKGNYIFGANLNQSSSNLCSYMPAGNKVYQSKVVKRGKPNDFWFNHSFANDLADVSGSKYSSGTVFEATSSSQAAWFLHDDQMDVERAWGITTSSNIGILLKDQEIATPHYDLNANIYKNTLEAPDNGIDDDGNNLIDDYEGWDQISWDSKPYINGVEDDLQKAVEDGDQHGTQMASIIGEVGNNEPWVGIPDVTYNKAGNVGVLWDVKILPISGIAVNSKTLNTPFGGLESVGGSSFGYEYAYDLPYDFRVSSESFVGQDQVTIDKAKFFGFLVCAGAGNTNEKASILYSSTNAITVGAVHYDGFTGNFFDDADGSTDFSTAVTVSGYSGGPSWYNSNGFYYPPSKNQYPFFAAGYLKSEPPTVPSSLLWTGNIDTNNPVDEPMWITMPTQGLTSGATAQASALSSMIWGQHNELIPEQVKAAIERGAITDIYDGRNLHGCGTADCNGGWEPFVGKTSAVPGDVVWVDQIVSYPQFNNDKYYLCTSGGSISGTGDDLVGGYTTWAAGVAYTNGDVVQATDTNYYRCKVSGTSAGNDSDLIGGSDTGVTWISDLYNGGSSEANTTWLDFTPYWDRTFTTWTIATPYTYGDKVKDSAGDVFICTGAGTSGGDDSDLANGSDTGVIWAVARLAGDWKTEGMLGAGRMSAYRSLTLWGTVSRDTIFTGDVYVSGDVVFAANVHFNNVTFHIAPYDIYQNEIDNGALTCQDQYKIDYTGFTSVDANEISIYIKSGVTFLDSGATAVFESYAEHPGTEDWGGIYDEGGLFFDLGGTMTVSNTTRGDH